jgi:Ser/Thr protein kinase RdoA (MazF antagonist)
VERLAEGRMAEVFAIGDDRVLKLDRSEWNGVAPFECGVLERLAAAGLPVARPHGTVTVEGRTGVVLERVHGQPVLAELLSAGGAEVVALAERFADLHLMINRTEVDGLPSLVPRLANELGLGALDQGLAAELTGLLARLDDGTHGVCHFDFHPQNVLAGPGGWVVIDWLGVADGPPPADLARTLVLWGRFSVSPVPEFLREVRRLGMDRRDLNDQVLNAWVRVVAGARLSEGFEGEDTAWLRQVAAGDLRVAE